MDLLRWIVVGIALYWVAVIAIRRLGWLPPSVNTTGPITTIRTRRGRVFLDRLSRWSRIWRAIANFGVGVALVVMVGSFVMLLFSAMLSAVDPAPGAVHEPQNVLVIPGVNQFLPLEVAPEIIFGLVIGLVVHEGGHGLLCRVEDIEIKSMGVALLAFIPLGAFVEPDQASTERSSRGAKTRMFAAGVTANFIVALAVFALLFGPIAGSLAVAPGAPVGGALPGSAAADAGIDAGDRITGFDGEPVDDYEAFEERLRSTTDRNVTVEINDERTLRVSRMLLVTGASPAVPIGIDRGDTIIAVDGEQTWTLPGFEAAITDRESVELTFERAAGGTATETLPIGSLATVQPDGPLADAGVEVQREIVITEIDGERVSSTGDLQTILADREPDSEVDVAYYADGERETVAVTLDAHPAGGGLLGVLTTPGTTGLSISDFGIREFPADRYLALLGGGDPEDDPLGVADSFLGKVVVAVFLPLASLILGGIFPFNFPGFTADTVNFFVVEGPLSIAGGGVFLLANLLFWTGWINLNLGFFNCIPAIPLDGGHLLRSSTEAIMARSPIGASHRVVGVFVTAIALLMLASFLVLIFGAGILAP